MRPTLWLVSLAAVANPACSHPQIPSTPSSATQPSIQSVAQRRLRPNGKVVPHTFDNPNWYFQVTVTQSPNFLTVFGSGTFTLTARYRTEPTQPVNWQVSSASLATVTPLSATGNPVTFTCTPTVGSSKGLPVAVIAGNSELLHIGLVSLNCTAYEKPGVIEQDPGNHSRFLIHFPVAINYPAGLPGQRHIKLHFSEGMPNAGDLLLSGGGATQSVHVNIGEQDFNVLINDGLTADGNEILSEGTVQVVSPSTALQSATLIVE